MTGRTVLFLILPFLTVTALRSQSPSQFVVMNITGTVNYVESPGANQYRLVSGQTLGVDAVISVSAGSSTRVVYEDQSFSLSAAGNYPLKSLLAKKTGTSSSFMKRFFNYVYDGIINTSGPKQIERYHEQYITQSSGGVKGFAGGTYGIAPRRPLMGNVLDVPVVIEWFSAGDSIIYDFQVFDFQTDGLLFKALLKDTSFQLDLGKLAVEPGRKYYWMVQQKHLGEPAIGFQLADDPSQRSPKMEFVVFNGQARLDEIIQALEASEEFRQADPADRLLMTAQAFEENDFVYEADRTLMKAMELSPANPIVERIYGAFLIRQGLWQSAQPFLSTH